MAFRLKHWLAAVGLSCAAVAVVLLPPHGEFDTNRIYPESNPARVTQLRLMRQIRALSSRQELLGIRDRVLQRIGRPGARENPPVVLAAEGVPESLRAEVERDLQADWRNLGSPRAARIALYLRIFSQPSEDVIAPTPPSGVRIVTLAPRVTDGETCIRVVTMNPKHRYVQRALDGRDPIDVSKRLAMGMGECGFYAAFGEPGHTVSQWLERADHRFALVADWYEESPTTHLPFPVREEVGRVRASYFFSTHAIACASGKTAACRPVIDGVGGHRRSFTPRTVGDGWLEESFLGVERIPLAGWHLGGAEMYMLSNLVREFGPASFARFWSTPHPFDSAFATLTGTTPESWAKRWVQRELGVLQAGPTVHAGLLAFGFLASALGLVVGMFFATRRTY